MVARNLPDPLRELRRSAAVIPMLVMVAVFVALGAAHGGYFETAFLPAGLLALALLVVSLLTISTRAKVPRLVVLAVGLLGAYAAWSYLSILWAADQGAAWEGANRALMYAVVFGLFALWPLREGPAAAVIGAFGLGVAGLGVVTLLRAGAAGDVSGMFVNGRFFEPVGYTNGNAALWFAAFLPCLFLAGRRGVAAPLRGLALGGAGLLAALSLLAQSRGWLVAVPVVLIIFFALVPGRVRHGVALAAVAVALLVMLDPVLAVLEEARQGSPLEPLISTAASTILVTSVVLALVGGAAALADRRIQVGASAARRARAATAIVLSLATFAGAVAVTVEVGDPIAVASDAWEEFRTGAEEGDGSGAATRFTSAGGQDRYDYWDVALSQFAERPLTGGGTGSFQNAYLREGETPQRPRFPHSLEVRLLSETGLIGALLFTGGVGAALFGGARAVTGRSSGAATAGVAISTFAYWAVHGSVDWFYELPALGAPAFALLGLAVALDPRRQDPQSSRPVLRPHVSGLIPTFATAVPAFAAALALALPWLAQLQVNAAIDDRSSDPTGALDRLEHAAALNPLSIEPHTTAAAIALRTGSLDVARREFEAVLARDPEDSYSTLQLAAIASSDGRREEARDLLLRAEKLSPQDALIEDALERLGEGETLDPVSIYEAALDRRSALTDPQ